jgi:hypothetical protein
MFHRQRTGERYDVDFFDVNTWDEYRLSPCIKQPLQLAPVEQRKSIIGVLSDSLPSLTSLPSSAKRASFFGVNGKDSSPERGRETTTDKVKDAADSAAGTAANAGQAASDIANPESNPPSLEPTMG